MSKLTLPKFSLVEKNNLGGTCDGCGRVIKYNYLVKENKTGKVFNYGSGCVKTHTEKSITEIVNENISYEKAEITRIRLEEEEKLGKTYIELFMEVNPKMMEFISSGSEENSFLHSMAQSIREKGSLTERQYNSVWKMMLPFAEFDKDTKIKDLPLYILSVKEEKNMWDSWTYTLTCITEDYEKVRVFFSSINEQKEKVFCDLGFLKFEHSDYVFSSTIEKEFSIIVSGTWDGYKLKRAKIKAKQVGVQNGK